MGMSYHCPSVEAKDMVTPPDTRSLIPLSTPLEYNCLCLQSVMRLKKSMTFRTVQAGYGCVFSWHT